MANSLAIWWPKKVPLFILLDQREYSEKMQLITDVNLYSRQIFYVGPICGILQSLHQILD